MAELYILGRQRVSAMKLDSFAQSKFNDLPIRRHLPGSNAGDELSVGCQVNQSLKNIVADRGGGDLKNVSSSDPAYQALPEEPL